MALAAQPPDRKDTKQKPKQKQLGPKRRLAPLIQGPWSSDAPHDRRTDGELQRLRLVIRSANKAETLSIGLLSDAGENEAGKMCKKTETKKAQ